MLGEKGGTWKPGGSEAPPKHAALDFSFRTAGKCDVLFQASSVWDTCFSSAQVLYLQVL